VSSNSGAARSQQELPQPSVRVISVSRTCGGIATVVLDVTSRERLGGRPATKARVEYNFQTDSIRPSEIAAEGIRMVRDYWRKSRTQ